MEWKFQEDKEWKIDKPELINIWQLELKVFKKR